MEGGGIRVCDCQLWERDPLGGVKVQEKRKSKRVKKESKSTEICGGKKRRRNGGECCFDVKGDGRAAVRRARGREKNKEEGVMGKAGGEGKRKSRPQTVSIK